MFNYTIAALLGAQVDAAATWDYKQNGRDWAGDLKTDCAGTNQSPINLISRNTPFAPPNLNGEGDMSWDYRDQKDMKAVWNGHTV
jgi:carbonic anhydrase